MKKFFSLLAALALVAGFIYTPARAQDITRSPRVASSFTLVGPNGSAQWSSTSLCGTAGIGFIGSDGGAYAGFCNGTAYFNSASIKMGTGGTLDTVFARSAANVITFGVNGGATSIGLNSAGTTAGAASTGAIRLQNGEFINARNAADNGDANLLNLTNGNVIQIGPSVVNTDIGSNVNASIRVGAGGPGAATFSVFGSYQNFGVPNVVTLTSDFTTAANTNLQTITGLSWTLPANMVITMPFRCVLYYSQATAAVADQFGLQTSTVTPTNFRAGATVQTAAGVVALGNVAIANTTATAVLTFTPSAITTIWNATLDGMIENPSNASTTSVNVMVQTSNSADLVTVKRGSFCRAF